MNGVMWIALGDVHPDIICLGSARAPIGRKTHADGTAALAIILRPRIWSQSVDTSLARRISVILKLMFWAKDELQILVCPDQQVLRQEGPDFMREGCICWNSGPFELLSIV